MWRQLCDEVSMLIVFLEKYNIDPEETEQVVAVKQQIPQVKLNKLRTLLYLSL